MNEKLLVREATLAERPAVVEVTRRAYSEYAEKSDPRFWTNYEASTKKTLLEDDGLRLIAEVNDEIVASVLLCPPYEKTMGDRVIVNRYPEMRLLAVVPEFRNLKLGGKLIDACEQKVQTEGFTTITLHTTVLMQTAKAMYERRGYSRFPDIDFEPTPNFVVWGFIKRFHT